MKMKMKMKTLGIIIRLIIVLIYTLAIFIIYWKHASELDREEI
jgi:hypothetical protein